jgi:hypothetical protein
MPQKRYPACIDARSATPDTARSLFTRSATQHASTRAALPQRLPSRMVLASSGGASEKRAPPTQQLLCEPSAQRYPRGYPAGWCLPAVGVRAKSERPLPNNLCLNSRAQHYYHGGASEKRAPPTQQLLCEPSRAALLPHLRANPAKVGAKPQARI